MKTFTSSLCVMIAATFAIALPTTQANAIAAKTVMQCASLEHGTERAEVDLGVTCGAEPQPTETVLSMHALCAWQHPEPLETTNLSAACGAINTRCDDTDAGYIDLAYAIEPATPENRRQLDASTACRPKRYYNDGRLMAFEYTTVQPAVGTPAVQRTDHGTKLSIDIASESIIEHRLLDAMAAFRLQPIKYQWHFGDGTSTTTGTPMAIHDYTPNPLLIQASVTITYQGAFSVDGAPFVPIDGTIRVLSRPLNL